MKRLLVLVTSLVGVVAVIGLSTAAHAYPPEQPSIAVSDTSIVAGGSVLFSGRALHAGETMTISVTYSSNGGTNFFAPRRVPRAVVGTTIADADGFWSANVRLTRSGRATLTAVGNMGTPPQSLTVRVAGSGDGGPSLAQTGDGAKVSVMLLSGIGAILLGGLLVFGAVRGFRRVRNTTGA